MYPSNVVVLRGRVISEPAVRELPSGSTVTQIELTTTCDGAGVSVPVVVEGRPVTVRAGDEVVVAGHVRRRFFRAGGVTQSRTEVVAAAIALGSRRRDIERCLAKVTALIAA